MSKLWFPTPAEKRAIRTVAAMSENRKGSTVHIEIGERYALTRADNVPWQDTISINLLSFPGEKEGLDNSDLHQTVGWSELSHGVPLTSDGRAVVDFYVYEKLVGDHGDLLTNVQAHVETVNGKPKLVKITGTGMPAVAGDTLNAFCMHPKQRALSVGAAAVCMWRQQHRAMWR